MDKCLARLHPNHPNCLNYFHPTTPSTFSQVYEQLGGVDAVAAHTDSLADYLHKRLAELRHSNGAPMVTFYGSWGAEKRPARSGSGRADSSSSDSSGGDNSGDSSNGYGQGPTLNFQLLQPDGAVFSYHTAVSKLSDAGIFLRCGCTCNPGSCYNQTVRV